MSLHHPVIFWALFSIRGQPGRLRRAFQQYYQCRLTFDGQCDQLLAPGASEERKGKVPMIFCPGEDAAPGGVRLAVGWAPFLRGMTIREANGEDWVGVMGNAVAFWHLLKASSSTSTSSKFVNIIGCPDMVMAYHLQIPFS